MGQRRALLPRSTAAWRHACHVSVAGTAPISTLVLSIIGEITKALKGGDAVTLVGFGTFQVRERAERTGRNPKTGDTIKIAASNNPSFKAGKALKDAVN